MAALHLPGAVHSIRLFDDTVLLLSLAALLGKPCDAWLNLWWFLIWRERFAFLDDKDRTGIRRPDRLPLELRPNHADGALASFDLGGRLDKARHVEAHALELVLMQNLVMPAFEKHAKCCHGRPSSICLESKTRPQSLS